MTANWTVVSPVGGFPESPMDIRSGHLSAFAYNSSKRLGVCTGPVCLFLSMLALEE